MVAVRACPRTHPEVTLRGSTTVPVRNSFSARITVRRVPPRTGGSHDPRRSPTRGPARRVDQPAIGPTAPLPRADHDVRDPDRHRGPGDLRARVGRRDVDAGADPRPDRHDGRPRCASRSGWPGACSNPPSASRRRAGSSRTPTSARGRNRCAIPLTGLGNHRAFQEEMERQWAALHAARPAAGPGPPRHRRLQADQRHPRSRRRRPPAAPRGDPGGDLPAPLGPGVPGRRRRVRDHPAGDRDRGRPRRHPAAPGRLPRGRGRGQRTDGGVVLRRHRRRSPGSPATAIRSTARPTRPSCGASATAGRA